ncbi:hypothetical protein [Algibacter sp. L1A34]|uniref:hypothetical protein n=1 Tax=Algibacter sp. L1A34 TaxID=2686365 RepID=UPI00131DCE0F|nr:hypothetical protein [Algibacter sp. L1A34]
MKIENIYRKNLDNYFHTITDFKHSTNRLNKVLIKDIEKYKTEESIYSSLTSLVIEDWTLQRENNSKLRFHTGINKLTGKENYPDEITKILSREFSFVYSQCYEAFERFLKDCIDSKIINDIEFKKLVGFNENYSRKDLKGGENIYKLIKKAGGKRLVNYSKNNINDFKFKELLKIFSEIRHSVTHNKGYLDVSKIPNNQYYKNLFEFLFNKNKLEGNKILIQFDIVLLNKVLVYLAEFGFQIYKILSEEDKYQWKIE